MERRFYRKINDRIIGGVCSGLADYIGMDKSIVRLLALVAIIASGVFPGLIAYFICVLIVPYDVQAYQGPRYDSHEQSQGYYEEGHYKYGHGEPWERETQGSSLESC